MPRKKATPLNKPETKSTYTIREKLKKFVPLESQEIMTITYNEGVKENVNVLVIIEAVDTQKQYIVYTKNETDENGNITIYIASLKNADSIILEIGCLSSEEYNKIWDWLWN